MYQEGNKFTRKLTIPCYETDSTFSLKPTAFMDMAQEMAYHAAGALGFGYEELQVHRTAWVLSRMHIHVHRAPEWRDEVLLSTWHKGADGLLFLRDFTLETLEGERLVSCTSSWLIINVDTRHLVRDPLGPAPALNEGPGEVPDAIAEPCPKIVIPKGAVPSPAGEHRVAYSDIDIIGHTNNARYVGWALDCLDYGIVTHKPLRDVIVNFNKETVPGQTVELQSFSLGDEIYAVEGLVEGKQAFCAEFKF